ncbi:MAG: hydrolase, partial [Sphingomonadaceae bacterium]|nr:hydrolase [Sphingomonadaceae bacterium]
MKLATIWHGGAAVAAIVDDDENTARPFGIDMLSVVRGGRARGAAGETLALSSVEILAPIPRPERNIFCVGKNYRAHAAEFTKSGFDSSAKDAADAIPTVPIIFSKVPQCVIANGAPILYP